MSSISAFSPSFSDRLDKVTLVGMRFYDGAADYLRQAAKRSDLEQRVFLLRDVGNPHDDNAVMAHNGKHKLGHVSRHEAKKVCEVLDELKRGAGSDQVLLLSIPPSEVTGNYASIQGKVIGFCPERPARKYAQHLARQMLKTKKSTFN